MRVAPIAPVKATPHGAYGYQRATKKHSGIDIGAKPGTTIVAPERMKVIAVAFDNATHPLSRYGPAATLNEGESGAVHVLGHMDAAVWPNGRPETGRTYEAGEVVGVVSTKNHLHWEVRRGDRAPWPLATRMADTLDPIAWLAAAPAPPPPPTLNVAAQMAAALRRAVVKKAVSGAMTWAVAILVVYAASKRRR